MQSSSISHPNLLHVATSKPFSAGISRSQIQHFPTPTTNQIRAALFSSAPSFESKQLGLTCNSNLLSLPLRPVSFRADPKLTSRLRQCGPVLCGNSSNTSSAAGGTSWIEALGELLSTAFPLWVALGCLLGLVKPAAFHWVRPKLTIMLLALTMLGMGMTLTFDDLRGALAMPKELISGFALQYSVMPLSGYFVSKIIGLPSHYAAGLILVACCPGGTASNIVTYIARGNVALSVLMTALSTVSAVIMTPFLTAKLAGQYVAVDAGGLLVSTLQVVLLPVLAGAFLNQCFQGFVKLVSPLMPPIAVGTVAILCGNAIAQNSAAIVMSGTQVALAVCLLHACGFFFGYLLARTLGVDESSARTISIEVGMQVMQNLFHAIFSLLNINLASKICFLDALYLVQNSVLGVVLASQHFSNPLTAVPCAVSSVCHSIFGSVLAGFWRRSVNDTA
ncbi:hypothetical protein V2J09_009118 [Rumex salicifolius]